MASDLGYSPDVRTLTPEELADLRLYLGSMTLNQMGAYLPNLLATLDAEKTAPDRLREAAYDVESAARQSLSSMPVIARDGRSRLIRALDALDDVRAALAPAPAAPLDREDLAMRVTTNLNVYQRRIDRGDATDFDRGKAAAFRVVLGMLDPAPHEPTFRGRRGG